MNTDHTLTAARLRSLVRYDAATGTLHWRVLLPRRKRGPLGAPAGHGGRLQTPIDGRAHYIHRLVWLYHHDEWPADQVDHINGDKRDNRIENLRVVSNGENAQNRRVRGVTYERRNGRWRARIMVDGKSISLGYFATEREALAEYQRAKLVYHESWATGVAAAA